MKKLLIILLLIVILFTSACSVNNPFITKTRSSGNPAGLEMKFLPTQSIYYEGDVPEVNLELTNNAECAISGVICVNQLLSGIGGITERCKSFNLAGLNLDSKTAKPDSTTLFFDTNEFTAYSGLARSNYETNINAVAVYNCRIITGPDQICVTPFKNDNLCATTETISGTRLGSRSAPITVTYVEKSISKATSGTRLRAIITLSKMDKGYVISQAALQNPNLEEQESPVFMKVNYNGYGEMSCRDENGVPITNNVLKWKPTESKKIINCEILLNINELTVNPIDIDLDFTYKLRESKQISIKKVGEAQ